MTRQHCIAANVFENPAYLLLSASAMCCHFDTDFTRRTTVLHSPSTTPHHVFYQFGIDVTPHKPRCFSAVRSQFTPRTPSQTTATVNHTYQSIVSFSPCTAKLHAPSTTRDAATLLCGHGVCTIWHFFCCDLLPLRVSVSCCVSQVAHLFWALFQTFMQWVRV